MERRRTYRKKEEFLAEITLHLTAGCNYRHLVSSHVNIFSCFGWRAVLSRIGLLLLLLLLLLFLQVAAVLLVMVVVSVIVSWGQPHLRVRCPENLSLTGPWEERLTIRPL